MQGQVRFLSGFSRAAILGWLTVATIGVPAWADTSTPARIPDLFDPNLHLQKPEVGVIKSIRFLTTDDFPPFHFAKADGTLAGFDIDLARAICADLKISCTIQARRFETLQTAIKDGEADALIAAIRNDATTRKTLAFTAPYYTTPARFVTKAGYAGAVTPEKLAKRIVGVQAGTAHEAYLRVFFPKAIVKPLKDQPALRDALRSGAIDLAFGDGIAWALWLNGTDAKACCAFQGGPYTESAYFGAGVSIAVAKGNTTLRGVLDTELAVLAKTGLYADLYLKYFPIGFY